jgi:hypothetical protein
LALFGSGVNDRRQSPSASPKLTCTVVLDALEGRGSAGVSSIGDSSHYRCKKKQIPPGFHEAALAAFAAANYALTDEKFRTCRAEREPKPTFEAANRSRSKSACWQTFEVG